MLMEIVPANISKLQKFLDSQNIIFLFTGPLSQNLLKDIVKNLQIGKNILNTDRSTFRRLITVIIELTQNMMYYAVKFPQNEKLDCNMAMGNGLLLLGRKNDTFFITCSNKIHHSQVSRIKNKLSYLQRLTPVEIKKYYIEQLNRSPQDINEIGGLGFIEMAKRTCKPIQFEFHPIDDDNQFLSITGHIKGGLK